MRKTRSQLSLHIEIFAAATTRKKSIYTCIYLNYEIHPGCTLKCNAGQTRQCNQQQEVLSKHCAWHYLGPTSPAATQPYPHCTHSVTRRKRKCGTKASSILASAFDICECSCSSSQINPHDTLAYRNKHSTVCACRFPYTYVYLYF